MNLKDILAKVTKGDALSEDERAFLAAYDPDQATNTAAAAARKKAEADAAKAVADAAEAKRQLDEMKAKLEESGHKGKSELQKLQEQVSSLTAQYTQAQAERAKLVRQQKLDDVIRTSGLQFVKEVDPGIMRNALVSEFATMTDEDLVDESKVKPILETFKVRNKAVVVVDGHGAGLPPRTPIVNLGLNGKPVEDMTAVEREADLKKRGVI